MPKKWLDPLQEGLPAAVVDVVTALRQVYDDGPFERLKDVEDAIVAARASTPDLVTVSAATCSRMLSPGRRGSGRTALPRWPSVSAFLTVHGVDPAPFAPRWTAARQAWASVPSGESTEPGVPPQQRAVVGTDEPTDPAVPLPGGPAPPAPGEPGRLGPSGRASPSGSGAGRQAGLLVAVRLLAGIGLFGAGVVVGLLVGGRAPASDAGAEASVQGAVPASAAPLAVTSPAVWCRGDEPSAKVRLARIAARDGLPGIGGQVRVDLEIVEAPANGADYWLMRRLLDPDDGVLVAESVLPAAPGRASVDVPITAPVGSAGALFVVEAQPDAMAGLREEHGTAIDAGGATSASEPRGIRTVSPTCQVVRTR